MSEQTYTGSCHCGAVEFDVTMSLDRLIACNCSICRRKGTILGFTSAEKFILKKGEDHLNDYQFGEKTIHHLFCNRCGVTVFAKGKAPDGTDTRAVNVRCLEDVDIDSLEVTKYDGKSL